MLGKNWLFSLLLVPCLLFMVGCSPEQTVSTSSTLTPLEKALSSGTPTLAEFGFGTCKLCKAMKLILDELALSYKNQLNVVIVNLDEYEDLATSYGIMAIPTQIFFDSRGIETFRHIGFFPENEIIAQLRKMGIE